MRTHCTVQPLESRRLLAADYDVAFGAGGRAVVGLGDVTAVNATVIQGDGKVLVAGSVGSDAFVARLSADGSRDGGFGTNGVWNFNLGDSEVVHDLLVLPDGKILAGGTTGPSNYFLARLRSDGQLDTGSGFGGTDGIVDGAGSIATLALRGTTLFSAGGDAVRKHDLASGALDTGFASSGVASVAGLTKLDTFAASDLAIRADGRLLVIGDGALPEAPPEGDEDFMGDEGAPDGLFLVALTAAGAADHSFDSDAVQVVYDLDFGGFAGSGHVAMDSADGDIYTAHQQAHHGGAVVLTRYSAGDGQIEWERAREFGLFDDSGAELALAVDGKPIVGRPGNYQRYEADGTIDTTFGGDGFGGDGGTISLTGDGIAIGPIAVAPNGRLVIVANKPNGTLPPDDGFNVLRLNDGPESAADNIKVTYRGTLVVRGEADADLIQIRENGPRITVLLDGHSVNLHRSRFKRVAAYLAGGDDGLHAYALTRWNITAYAGGGRDSLVGGQGDDLLDLSGDITDGDGGDSFYAYLYGGVGNDTLIGSDSHDSIKGEDGDDLIAGGAGDDIIDGVAGADTMSGGGDTDTLRYDGLFLFTERATGVLVIADGIANDGETGEGDDVDGTFEWIWGTPGNDYLIGSDSGNRLHGLGGDDTLVGNGGGDLLDGGDGRDRLYGGGGNDRLVGGPGRDHFHPGPGTDTLEAAAGSSDWLYSNDDSAPGDSLAADGTDLVFRDEGDIFDLRA